MSNAKPAKIASLTEVPSLAVNESNQRIDLKGKGVDVSFDKASGLLSSYKVDGKETLVRGPWMNTFRAFTDNDIWFQKSYWDSGLGTMAHRELTITVVGGQRCSSHR
jgi:hypothetical protein